MATAWGNIHKPFEGVYGCLHPNPPVGGLAPGEMKRLRGNGNLYLPGNEVKVLLKQ